MSTPAGALLYGATGYTGRLIARAAAQYGVRPVLAGRDAAAVARLGDALGLEHRTFSLHDPAVVDAGLEGMRAVLHCAGPFIHTSRPMADACIRRRVHYLDITGEIEVIESLAARDADARAADVMLLPGAGFDVVPTDCLAAHLAHRLPTASRLMLGIRGTGPISRGTATTMVEHMGRGGMVRRGGRLTRVPIAWRTRRIDFGDGERTGITIPWGDVATAWYTTGIGDIEVYASAGARQRRMLKAARHLGWLLRSGWVKSLAKRRIRARPAGPDAAELAHGRSMVWGRVEDAAGAAAETRLEGPNGYTITAHTALLILRRVLDGVVLPGFATPALAYGPDLVLEVPGVTREDLA